MVNRRERRGGRFYRYSLGVHYEQSPVNKSPSIVANCRRDGQMREDGNGGSDPNYYLDRFDDIDAD